MEKGNEKEYKIAYVVSDLKRVGPSNQTLNIIKNSKFKDDSVVVTLFEEPVDTMIEEYKKSNIDIISLKLNRKIFFLTGKFKLKKLFMMHNIKLVHSYGVKPDCICYNVCKSLNIKHVITLRNYPKEDILTRMGYLKGKIALMNHLNVLNKAEHIVACSKTICKKMKNDYPDMNIIAIQNGVDTQKYGKISDAEKKKLKEKYDISSSKVFISTSSFIPRKRIEETIQGFLKANRQDSCLVLLGDGMLFESIKNKYEKNQNIKFVGKTNKVEEYLNLSDAFISSSESEGLPNGVIEAIASNIPVILSDIPQHIEIVDELKMCGEIYTLGDVNELSEIIKNINFNKYSADIIESPFTMKNMSEKYQRYYVDLNKEIY